MAYLRQRDDSSIWLARFLDSNGKKKEKSTGTRDRREAQKIADAFEAASQRKFTAAHVQRTLRELMADATAVAMPGSSIFDFFTARIKRAEVENARATVEYYRRVFHHFGTWCSTNLPQQNQTEMSAVQPAHIDGFRAYLKEKISPSTVNHIMKLMRQLFDDARRQGMLLESPCVGIKPIKRHDPGVKSPFTIEQVRTLLLAAGDEWKSLISFGLYTGQRLGDLAALHWRNVYFERGELSFKSRKTGKQMTIPLATPLIILLAETPVLDRTGPLHPHAFDVLQRHGKTAVLSNEFYQLMSVCGIVDRRPHHKKAEPKPQSTTRVMSPLSFHSLRHTATSMLRDAGAPVGVSMELIGHQSRIVHQHYSHLGTDTLRRAVSLLPTL